MKNILVIVSLLILLNNGYINVIGGTYASGNELVNQSPAQTLNQSSLQPTQNDQCTYLFEVPDETIIDGMFPVYLYSDERVKIYSSITNNITYNPGVNGSQSIFIFQLDLNRNTTGLVVVFLEFYNYGNSFTCSDQIQWDDNISYDFSKLTGFSLEHQNYWFTENTSYADFSMVFGVNQQSGLLLGSMNLDLFNSRYPMYAEIGENTTLDSLLSGYQQLLMLQVWEGNGYSDQITINFGFEDGTVININYNTGYSIVSNPEVVTLIDIMLKDFMGIFEENYIPPSSCDFFIQYWEAPIFANQFPIGNNYQFNKQLVIGNDIGSYVMNRDNESEFLWFDREVATEIIKVSADGFESCSLNFQLEERNIDSQPILISFDRSWGAYWSGNGNNLLKIQPDQSSLTNDEYFSYNDKNEKFEAINSTSSIWDMISNSISQTELMQGWDYRKSMIVTDGLVENDLLTILYEDGTQLTFDISLGVSNGIETLMSPELGILVGQLSDIIYNYEQYFDVIVNGTSTEFTTDGKTTTTETSNTITETLPITIMSSLLGMVIILVISNKIKKNIKDII